MSDLTTTITCTILGLIGRIGIGFHMMGIIEIIIDKEQKGDENDND